MLMAISIVGGIIVLAAIAIYFVINNQPPAFHVERSITIAAPAGNAFDLVNSFPQWRAWSPWEKMDPQLNREYGGSPEGTGATYHWVGNRKVGEGRMTIERSEKSSLIEIKLEFLKPMTATNRATFSFTPAPDGTKVTWAMDGKHDCFIGKAFGLIMNFDKMIGKDFEKGLSNMKAAAEQSRSTVAV